MDHPKLDRTKFSSADIRAIAKTARNALAAKTGADLWDKLGGQAQNVLTDTARDIVLRGGASTDYEMAVAEAADAYVPPVAPAVKATKVTPAIPATPLTPAAAEAQRKAAEEEKLRKAREEEQKKHKGIV